MSELNAEKAVQLTVEGMIEELKKNPSSRFSRSDFQTLIFAILSDKSFKAKKYLLRNNEIIEDTADISGDMIKFMDKLLKHAGMTDPSERARTIEEFKISPRDLEWVADAVDEAMYIYTESGKNMRVFRDKMLQLTLRKMVRTGSHEGKVTYKKSVMDRAASLQKRKGKES